MNNVTKIIGIAAIIIVAVIAGLWFTMSVSYNNEEVSLRQQAEAQRGKIEGVYDNMWKIIAQKAEVSSQYEQSFKEIYPELISARYQNDNGTLMKWIQESNPNFDTSLYKDLMQSIELQRTIFTKAQERMLDIIREHTVLCESFPGKYFISNKTPIDYTVISSTRAKTVVNTGIDDDVDLFKNNKK